MSKYSKLLWGLLFALVVHVIILKSGIIEYFDYKIYDITNDKIIGTNKNGNSSVVIIDIDEKSLKYLGQWPWSRVVLAQLINTINNTNPASMGLDVIFPEADKTSLNEIISFYQKYLSTKLKIDGISQELFDNDILFSNQIAKAKTTLAVYMSNEKNDECYVKNDNLKILDDSSIKLESKYILCNIEKLQKEASSIGFINSSPEIDGIFRKMTLFIKNKDKILPAFALANLMNIDTIEVNKNVVKVLEHQFTMDEESNVLLKFYEKKSYKTISAIDVLSGQFDKNMLRGKFVLLGTSAVGLYDNYLISNGQSLPGVYAHATLIENILNDDLIYQPKITKNIGFTLSIFLSFLLVFFLYKQEYIKLIILFIFSCILSFFLAYIFLSLNKYISIGYFLIPFLIHFFIINIVFIYLYYEEKKKFYKDLTKAHSSAIDSMALVAETRDTETGAHIKRTKEYMYVLGEYLYENGIYKNLLTKHFRDLMYRATPLHDIGKVGIPDIILKKPEKLSDDEYTIMKTHPEIGKNIIENAMKDNGENQFLKIAFNICYYHHEKWDGSGYPCKLQGNDIPLEARMMALADVYDALISRRCYKLAFTYEDSENIIIDGSGTHFDPILIGVFIELKEQFREIAERIKE